MPPFVFSFYTVLFFTQIGGRFHCLNFEKFRDTMERIKNKVPDHHQVKSIWYFSDCHGLSTRELANITIDRLVTLTRVSNDVSS